MPPRFRHLVRRERPACGRFQTQGDDLKTVGLGIETEAIGDRQTRPPEGRKVRGLRPESTGVSGLIRGKRDDQLHASFLEARG